MTPDRERLIADLERHRDPWEVRKMCLMAALELRRLGDLEARLEAAEKERDKWMTRCAAAVSFLPDDLTIGDLRYVTAEYQAALAHPSTPADERREG